MMGMRVVIVKHRWDDEYRNRGDTKELMPEVYAGLPRSCAWV